MKSDLQKYHIPVLLQESLEYLNLNPEGVYIDGTLGEGGHSIEILKGLKKKGTLISIDQDISAIEFVKEFYKEHTSKLPAKWVIEHSNFAKIKEIMQEHNLKADGILLDIGISSRQLEQKRGFSYNELDAPLDMRMNTQSLGVKAKDLLIVLTEHELTKLFGKYGEERLGRQIAKGIKRAIDQGEEINTVGDLNQVIQRAVPAAVRQKKKHPSMRVFQALRIAINDELNSLADVIEASLEVLNPQGRLVIITFHSLEDRIVKRAFIDLKERGIGEIITPKPISATDKELQDNSRAHSAKLRVFQKS